METLNVTESKVDTSMKTGNLTKFKVGENLDIAKEIMETEIRLFEH